MKLSRQQAAVIVGTVVFLVIVLFQSWAGRPITVDSVLSTLIVGVSIGSIYAIAASGIVVTYTTSGIFNFAQGAIGMFMAFTFWELKENRGWPSPLALFVACRRRPIRWHPCSWSTAPRSSCSWSSRSA